MKWSNNYFSRSSWYGLILSVLILLFVPYAFAQNKVVVIPLFDSNSSTPLVNGKKVAPGLYEVHTRVLWDVGWMRNDNELENGYFAYYQTPRNLVYAGNRELFLSPLKAYGIPEVQEGATRKVRLYVHYGEQIGYPGTPTVVIGDVEFNLPKIGGFYVDMGANWSNYVTYEEYQHVGHANIQMYLKNPWPLPERPYGVVYRIEAHFYDEFPQ